jgi:hypothetical protein
MRRADGNGIQCARIRELQLPAAELLKGMRCFAPGGVGRADAIGEHGGCIVPLSVSVSVSVSLLAASCSRLDSGRSAGHAVASTLGK